MTLRVAFLGTFHPAVPTLRRLAERGQVALLVVPAEAGSKNDELLTIADEFDLVWSYELRDVDPREVDVVVAANYPKLVPQRLLTTLPCVNTHWSLLPRYRGVHPTAWALINGDDETGVTVHLMEQEFDTGPVLAQARVPLTPDTQIMELHRRLADLQADLVIEVLEHLNEHGALPPASRQIESEATYVPQRVPADGLIDWTWPTARIDGLVRALPAPDYPGAFTYVNDRKLIVWTAEPAPTPRYFSTPGQVVRALADGSVWVKTGDTCLAVRRVQWEDEERERRPREVLPRGARLGTVAEAELVNLRQRLVELERECAALRSRI